MSISPTRADRLEISDEGLPVECFSIDELFADTPLTFIKMDIEGAEYDALLGALKVIQRDRPILAICVYHTQNDIWRIPTLRRGRCCRNISCFCVPMKATDSRL